MMKPTAFTAVLVALIHVGLSSSLPNVQTRSRNMAPTNTQLKSRDAAEPSFSIMPVASVTSDAASDESDEAPVKSAAASARSAAASVRSTAASVRSTAASDRSTEASVKSTAASVRSDAASDESNEAPVKSATASARSAAASVRSTAASVKSTAASVESDDAHVKSVAASVRSDEASVKSAVVPAASLPVATVEIINKDIVLKKALVGNNGMKTSEVPQLLSRRRQLVDKNSRVAADNRVRVMPTATNTGASDVEDKANTRGVELPAKVDTKAKMLSKGKVSETEKVEEEVDSDETMEVSKTQKVEITDDKMKNLKIRLLEAIDDTYQVNSTSEASKIKKIRKTRAIDTETETSSKTQTRQPSTSTKTATIQARKLPTDQPESKLRSMATVETHRHIRINPTECENEPSSNSLESIIQLVIKILDDLKRTTDKAGRALVLLHQHQREHERSKKETLHAMKDKLQNSFDAFESVVLDEILNDGVKRGPHEILDDEVKPGEQDPEIPGEEQCEKKPGMIIDMVVDGDVDGSTLADALGTIAKGGNQEDFMII